MHHSLIADKHFIPLQLEFLIRVGNELFRVTHDLDTFDWTVEHGPTGRIHYNGKLRPWKDPVKAIRQYCDDQKIQL